MRLSKGALRYARATTFTRAQRRHWKRLQAYYMAAWFRTTGTLYAPHPDDLPDVETIRLSGFDWHPDYPYAGDQPCERGDEGPRFSKARRGERTTLSSHDNHPWRY